MFIYNAVHDKGWTKVQTQGKPSPAECKALRKVGLSFSPKVGWYIPHLFDLARLEQLLDKYLPEPQGPAEDPVMEPGEELSTKLPLNWTREDIEFLLDKMDDGCVLISHVGMGIPTIHGWPNPKHIGFGYFETVIDGAKYLFEGGGAMDRTPSGKGWCYLRRDDREVVPVEVYDHWGVYKRLQSYLADAEPEEEEDESPPPKAERKPNKVKLGKSGKVIAEFYSHDKPEPTETIIEDHLGRIVKGGNGSKPEVHRAIERVPVDFAHGVIDRIEVEKNGTFTVKIYRGEGYREYDLKHKHWGGQHPRIKRLQTALRNRVTDKGKVFRGVNLVEMATLERSKSTFKIGSKSVKPVKKIRRKAAKHKLNIMDGDGSRWTNPVKGYVVPETPGLFIHRPTIRDENIVDGWKSDTSSKVWCITHIKSGYSIWARLETLTRLDDAVKFVFELGKVNIDWTVDAEQIKHDTQAEGVNISHIYHDKIAS